MRGEAGWWKLSDALVPRGRAYDFNQALMDFGATWCTPRKPRCTPCPMQAFCASHPRR
jgi:A/G-specific adenine glycosylase